MKNLAIFALVAFAGLTQGAAAQSTVNYIATVPPQGNRDAIELPFVSATVDSTLYIVRITGADKNEVLGSVEVPAGIMQNVRVRLDRMPRASAVMAVLYGNDEVLDYEKIEIGN
jgi:hypothetical protein